MEKKVYEVPAAEIVLLREDIVAATLSNWGTEGSTEGGFGGVDSCENDDWGGSW